MVDSTKGIGPLQGFISGTRVSDPKPGKDVKGSAAPKDQVNISQEALSLSQAEEKSSAVREALEKNPQLTLGTGRNFDESL